MSYIFSRNFHHLKNCLVIGANIRCARFYSGKSLLDRYKASPLTLTTYTEAAHRQALTSMPRTANCHANFFSTSKEHVESEQCKESREGGEPNQVVEVLVFNLIKQKSLVLNKGTTEPDGKKDEIIIRITVELSLPRMKDVIRSWWSR